MNASPHILVVDDDREIRDLLARFLRKHGYRVDVAADGRAMLEHLDGGRFDLVVLDLMLPGEDGLSLCRRVRVESHLPIIMLTAIGEETDRIIGLEMGADDYLAKPFNPRELLARIRAVLRRAGSAPAPSEAASDDILGFEGWRLDLSRRQLHSPDDALVDLTAGEFELLAALAAHPQRVLSREQLLDLTRGRAAVPYDRAIDVGISRLRQKIEADAKNPAIIKTVRGGGYVFAAKVARP
ncbi:MAG: response regulator [Alphaproteobacteria bacterium]|jgi:two-component system OmpR family response regulator|nr:response regulator [Alphaproteobacteria bacterium]MDP6812008.1 response regulator [Alphaproteobacteria bacterium]